MRVSILAVYTAALVLAGCTTTPVPSSEATPVARSKHLLFKQSSANIAPALVIRDSGFNTSACDSKIIINGQLAAYIGTSEKVMLHIPAGEVIIGVVASGICAGGLNECQPALVATHGNWVHWVADCT